MFRNIIHWSDGNKEGRIFKYEGGVGGRERRIILKDEVA